MTLTDIYDTFKTFTSNYDRIKFLRLLQQLSLSYDINYDNLITYWETHID